MQELTIVRENYYILRKILSFDATLNENHSQEISLIK